jgi:hypothetical protein
MRLFIRLAVFFYIFIIFLVGITALLVLAHAVDFDQYSALMRLIYLDERAATVMAVIISAVLATSLVFARIIFGRQEKEKNIHFDNSLGRVTISLSAVEDLVRRLVIHTPQIREIRPTITSTKKGLQVDLRLVLCSDVNIPELVAEFQEIIRRKIQDMFGNEETILIRVHVIKITSDGPLRGKGPDEGPVVMGQVPFHGYRA